MDAVTKPAKSRMSPGRTVIAFVLIGLSIAIYFGMRDIGIHRYIFANLPLINLPYLLPATDCSRKLVWRDRILIVVSLIGVTLLCILCVWVVKPLEGTEVGAEVARRFAAVSFTTLWITQSAVIIRRRWQSVEPSRPKETGKSGFPC